MRQDPNAKWIPNLDGAIPRETVIIFSSPLLRSVRVRVRLPLRKLLASSQLMAKSERVAIMRATSDYETRKAAKKTTRVSRRKGRRTALHVPQKQQRHEEAREEYILSGKKEENERKRRDEARNVRAALEIIQENVSPSP